MLIKTLTLATVSADMTIAFDISCRWIAAYLLFHDGCGSESHRWPSILLIHISIAFHIGLRIQCLTTHVANEAIGHLRQLWYSPRGLEVSHLVRSTQYCLTMLRISCMNLIRLYLAQFFPQHHLYVDLGQVHNGLIFTHSPVLGAWLRLLLTFWRVIAGLARHPVRWCVVSTVI